MISQSCPLSQEKVEKNDKGTELCYSTERKVMLNMLRISLILFVVVSVSCQKNPYFVGNRTTIVHLFEWKWKDIAQECENFLSKHGYGGVQVSPANENLVLKNRPWYERYQPVSYVLQTRSGNEEDFKEMTRRCNKAGIRIFVDVILNHMSGGDGRGTANNLASATNKNYPAVPYTSENFHSSCALNDFNNEWEARNCELVGLKDLDQSQEYVRGKLVGFLNHLVELGVAGFRVDAAKHILPSDMKIIFDRVRNLNTDYRFPENARAFVYQEVDKGGDIRVEDYFSVGTVLDFSYGRLLTKVFKKQDKLRYLNTWGPQWGLISSGYDAVTFIDNHDTQRYEDVLSYKNSKPYKMAVAFMLAHPYGTGRIMSSYDFVNKETPPPHDADGNLLSPGFREDNTCTNGYICEHRWRQMYNMVKFREVVTGTSIENWQTLADQQIAFCRGNKGFIVFNNEGTIDKGLQTCLPEGNYCDIITGDLINGRCSGKEIHVGNDGIGHIHLRDDEGDGMIAIHLNSKKD